MMAFFKGLIFLGSLGMGMNVVLGAFVG